MKLKIPTILSLVLATGLSVANAQTLMIDNFDGYADTVELQNNWNSFGTAASSGAPTLGAGEGVAGSNAAVYSLNWFDGNNANMRRINLGGLDLSAYSALDVTMYVETDAGNDAPTASTVLKVAIQSSDSTIWQTSATFALAPNVDSYSILSFNLSEAEMDRVAGSGTFADTLADVDNLRLRFENAQEVNVGQTAYVSSIAAIPEPSTYALLFGGLMMSLALVRRRR